MRSASVLRMLILVFLCMSSGHRAFSQKDMDPELFSKIDGEILRWMAEGHIPGLSLAIIDSGRQFIRTYGYQDRARKSPVTVRTLFELGSCSKAFTALAVEKLVSEGAIRLDGNVSDYLPWFRVSYKDSLVNIKVLQLLHHTSGIPWQTISSIPVSSAPDALEQTVRNVNGTKLKYLPGKRYEYATVNYDILALIIERVTHEPFERYLQRNVLDALGLKRTTIGAPLDSNSMSLGYKIGFFGAREYAAPRYRGNDAAGYVISDISDFGRWLRFQMGMTEDTGMYALAIATHKRDETVPLHGMFSYAMGWDISLRGDGEITHGGLNPNFTAYVAFRPEKEVGVALLANSNSSFTPVIGSRIMKLLAKEKMGRQFDPGDGNDRVYSIVSIMAGVYMLALLVYSGVMVSDIRKGRRTRERFSGATLKNLVWPVVIVIPFLTGLYLFPLAIARFTWESMLVWSPVSFEIMMLSIVAALGLSYAVYFIGLLYPEKNKFKKVAPRILMMSILSGIANMVVIVLITSALGSDIRLRYLVYYYLLAIGFYLLGRRFVQVKLIQFTRGLIYELRVDLIGKIFSTTYQKFEKIDRGRVYTALNDDVELLGGSADQFIMLITNGFTVIAAFLYLASMAFWTATIAILLILGIGTVYFFVSRSTADYFEKARDTQNIFMRLANGMIDGFKEISLHSLKKQEYKADIAHTADEYRQKISTAGIRFVNAFLFGEFMLVMLLGALVFALPRLFPEIQTYTIMGFVIVLLYLIGPINGILGSIPAIMQLRVSWNRLQAFRRDIPANAELTRARKGWECGVQSIRGEGIEFRYRDDHEKNAFSVGPIDLEVRSGEVLFIIGGNGSGKTTLAKLLTGLYEPDKGRWFIDDKAVEAQQLGEYFSAVFSPAYLFEKLYTIDAEEKRVEIVRYLKLLGLEDKVDIENGQYTTINLSGGQRKRLALLQCYLEDSPIYLFDEWAADQDPEYRKFFYRVLLPDMKSAGKIIIAITHDDHYFDVADKVLRMRQGQLEVYKSSQQWILL